MRGNREGAHILLAADGCVYSVVCSGCTVYALRCLCIQVRSKQAGESRRSLAVHRAAPLWWPTARPDCPISHDRSSL